MTLFQPAEKTEAVLPNTPLYPVTFPEESAAASLKIHLAYLLTKKKETFQKLHEITIGRVESTLVFIPFTSKGSELVHPQLGIGFQRQTLPCESSCQTYRKVARAKGALFAICLLLKNFCFISGFLERPTRPP
jgi:hypothetical protein